MKDINKKELINSPCFVREPVDKINKTIEKMNNKEIIINGGSGCGKSISLLNLERRNIGFENQYIYTDTIPLLNKYYGNLFSEEFYNHYIELCLCNKLIRYLKDNYDYTYQNDFIFFEYLIKCITKDTDYYINFYPYDDSIKLTRILSIGEISSTIVEKMKRCLDIRNVNLIIDRFDQTDILIQETMEKFFKYFDKIVYTVDDNLNLHDKNELKMNNHEIITVNYGTSKSIIKSIIFTRLNYYKSMNRSLDGIDENTLDEVIIDNLSSKFGSDIDSILVTVKNTLNNWIYNKHQKIGNVFDLEIKNTQISNRDYAKIKVSPQYYKKTK